MTAWKVSLLQSMKGQGMYIYQIEWPLVTSPLGLLIAFVIQSISGSRKTLVAH